MTADADPDRAVHAGREVGGRWPRPAMPMPTGTRMSAKTLTTSIERQRHVVAAVVVVDRQVGDQRQRDDRDDRVDRGQRDVERDVAAEQVAEQVGRRAARGRGQQHHADAEQRRQVEEHAPARSRPPAAARAGRPARRAPPSGACRPARKSAERQPEPEPEHDDAERDRQPDGGQRGVHGGTLGVIRVTWAERASGTLAVPSHPAAATGSRSGVSYAASLCAR